MKKFLLIIAIVLISVPYSFAATGKPFATSGVIEINGTIGFSGYKAWPAATGAEDYSGLTFNFSPVVQFYIIHGFHVGVGPNFTVDTVIDSEGAVQGTQTDTGIGPEIFVGYTFKLNDVLFFDLAPSYCIQYVKATGSDDYDARDDDFKRMFFQLTGTFKFAIGHALINVGIFGRYDYRTWDDEDFGTDFFTAGVNVGFGIYF